MAHRQWCRPAEGSLRRNADFATAAAIDRGTIAAGILAEPFIAAAGGSVRAVAKPYDFVAKIFMQNCWFTSRAWLAKNGATAHKLASCAYETAR
jgi:hypothetical protein